MVLDLDSREGIALNAKIFTGKCAQLGYTPWLPHLDIYMAIDASKTPRAAPSKGTRLDQALGRGTKTVRNIAVFVGAIVLLIGALKGIPKALHSDPGKAEGLPASTNFSVPSTPAAPERPTNSVPKQENNPCTDLPFDDQQMSCLKGWTDEE